MANLDRPSGLNAIGTLSGAELIGKLRGVTFLAAETNNMFVGDLVARSALIDRATDTSGKRMIVEKATAGGASIGVIQSFVPIPGNEASLSANFRSGSVKQDAIIYWGQDVLYTCQEDGALTPLAADDPGLNINFIDGGGSTITGISGFELNSDSVGVGAALNFRLHSLSDQPDNEIGEFADWVVSINNSQEALNQLGT